MVHPRVWRWSGTALTIFAIVAGGGSAGVCPGGAAGRRGRKKYALLVGVDRYGKGTLLPGLAYPQRDVEGLADALVDAGYAPGRHRGDDPQERSRGVRPAADGRPRAQPARLAAQAAEAPRHHPGDAGRARRAHGGAPRGGGGGRPVPTSFFCPMDADLKDRDPAKLIAFDEFFDGLARSRATTKLLLVDACRNELKTAPPEARAPGIETAPPPPPPPSVAALYACSENEVSWEDSTLGGGHGVFSHFVIEGLKGAADENGDRNGALTLNELTEYVQDNVFRFVRTRRAVSQEPRLLAIGVPRIVLRDVSGLRTAELITTRTAAIRLKLIPAGEFLMGSTKADDPDA